MNCSVNLVPLDCLHARARGKRRNGWAIVTLGAAAFLLTVWIVSGTASRAVERVGQRLADAQARQLALNRELADTHQRRAQLVDRLRLLCGLQQPQPWPQRLTTLVRESPPGIVLTEVIAANRDPRLRGKSFRPPQLRSPAGAGRREARLPPARAERGTAAARPDASGWHGLDVQLAGVATTHDELTRLIQALQHNEGWSHMELTRAGRQPFLNGLAVGFEIAGQVSDAVPQEPESTPPDRPGTGGAP
jgi:Tfp pilus assembly protein PilN